MFSLLFHVVLSFVCISIMEERSVVASGLDESATYVDIESFFKSIGAVEQVVRVIGPGMKFGGKAYAVYVKKEDATSAALRLSKNDIKVQAIGADTSEFKALVEEKSGATAQPSGLEFFQRWGGLGPEQQAAVMKLMGIEKPETPISPASFFSTNMPVVVQEKPHLPTFSGSGKDCSYGRWKYDVKCLMGNQKYSVDTVLEAVRKSLKSPAADVLPRLGINPTLQQVINKMDSTYGSVLSGQAILQKFYTDEQGDESCVAYSMRLEDWIFQAAEKKALSEEAVTTTLTQKFWSGIKDENIKNALRHRYATLDFEQVLSEARAIEEESSSVKKNKARSQQVTGSEDSKLDILIKKMERMESELQELKGKKKEHPPETTKEPVVCTKCNLKGHLYFGCKQGQDIECRRCKLKGHIARSCRSKGPLNKQ